MYNVDFLLFPKNFVSICLNSIHENYCVYMCCPIFSGSTSAPSQLSALGRSLQKSWLCSGQRDLCWLTECCCHNLSSWLLRRISGRPQSSSPESSEPCNYPWSSQSLCGRGNKEEYFKTSVSSSMLCKVEVLGPGKAPNLLKEQICLEDGLVCQPSPTPTC